MLYLFLIDSVSQKKISALQRELIAEKEFKVKLATEMKDMHTQLQKMKVERSRLIASVSEKVNHFSFFFSFLKQLKIIKE